MSEQDEMDWLPPNATPELAPNAPPGTVRVATGSVARFVNAQEAQDFGISTERACLVIEQVFYDAEDDVLQHTVTVNYSGRPHAIWYQPTPEEDLLQRPSASWTARPSAGILTRGGQAVGRRLVPPPLPFSGIKVSK